MIIYTPIITPRLRYSADFIGRELLGKTFELTDQPDIYRSYPGPRINYSSGKMTDGEFHLLPHTLLVEQGLRQQDTRCSDANGHKTFFHTSGDWPFDIFAAVFYLLSRYEEYLPHTRDMYGRYAHENALAFREKFLEVPLVNQWLLSFREKLQEFFPGMSFEKKNFRFIPTYDIDEAFAYKHKQWWRSAGAALRDLATGRTGKFRQRRNVLDNRERDPYDAFGWMDDLHRTYPLHPRYFFLLASKTGRFDKNNLPGESAMRSLVKEHAGRYAIGIHPSWQSGDNPALINEEIKTLAGISGHKITASRQHYIRMNLPQTYRYLCDAGIHEDHSMGYGSINGFRASVASPFYWYDLEREQTTDLLLHPFCYMEANSYFEQKMSAPQALEEMRHYHRVVREVNGTLITIWHNTFLGTDTRFAGWREVYAQFIKEVCH